MKPCLAESAEIKQTKFKKVGVLMKNLEIQGIIVVKDQKKGTVIQTFLTFKPDNKTNSGNSGR